MAGRQVANLIVGYPEGVLFRGQACLRFCDERAGISDQFDYYRSVRFLFQTVPDTMFGKYNAIPVGQYLVPTSHLRSVHLDCTITRHIRPKRALETDPLRAASRHLPQAGIFQSRHRIR